MVHIGNVVNNNMRHNNENVALDVAAIFVNLYLSSFFDGSDVQKNRWMIKVYNMSPMIMAIMDIKNPVNQNASAIDII